MNFRFLMIYCNGNNTPTLKVISSKNYILDTLGVKENINLIKIETFKYGSIFLYVYSNNFDRTVVLFPTFYTNSLVADVLLFHLNEQLLILFLSFLSKWKTSPHLPQGSLSYFYLNSVSKIYMYSNLKNWLN
jgi:hypothetical protein